MKRLVVEYERGAIIDWSPNVIARMAIVGVEVDGKQLPQPMVWRRLWSAFKAWFEWTCALPGDTFHDFQRDLIIRVVDGLPFRRRVQVCVGVAMRYPTAQKLGLHALLDIEPIEPSQWRWNDVYRVRVP